MPSQADQRPTRTVAIDTEQATSLRLLAARLTQDRGEPVTIRELVRDAIENVLQQHGMSTTKPTTPATKSRKKKPTAES